MSALKTLTGNGLHEYGITRRSSGFGFAPLRKTESAELVVSSHNLDNRLLSVFDGACK
jgi:hypothetical protein